MEINSIGLVTGFMVGIQHEELHGENYLIISLGIIEIILVW